MGVCVLLHTPSALLAVKYQNSLVGYFVFNYVFSFLTGSSRCADEYQTGRIFY
jgi:hypothetical protein